MTSVNRTTKVKFRVDPRFVIGAVLVVASVIGVLVVLGFGRTTTPVYVTTGPVAVGDSIAASQLTLVHVDLAGADDRYLTPESLGSAEVIATRPIGSGEFVPVDALGAADTTVGRVLIPVAGGVPTGIEPGAAVELWASMPGEHGTFEPPIVLVESARVTNVSTSESVIASRMSDVELQVPRAQLPNVLAAIANGAKLSIVPLYAPAGI